MPKKAKVLDPAEDFESPVRRQPSLTSEQPDGPEEGPPTVQNGKTLMQFVRLRPTKETDGERLLRLEMSCGLTGENVEQFSKDIRDAYEMLASNEKTLKGIDLANVEAQTVAIYEASDDAKPSLRAAGVKPQRVSVTVVEETGSTAARDVIRLSMSLPIPQTPDAGAWALRMHGELVWVEMFDTQAGLGLKASA